MQFNCSRNEITCPTLSIIEPLNCGDVKLSGFVVSFRLQWATNPASQQTVSGVGFQAPRAEECIETTVGLNLSTPLHDREGSWLVALVLSLAT